VSAGLAALVVTQLVLTGCGTEPGSAAPSVSASPVITATSRPKPARVPAAAAGGACRLLDFAVVEQVIGVAFEVAAAGQQEATYTCVLQRVGASVPDLMLTVTPSSATVPIFRTVLTPKGAAALTGLGKVGYRARVPAVVKAGRGPGVEIGWLSGNQRILVLRVTLAAGVAVPAAEALAPKLLALAKRLDQTRV
jgi:hypothetical protein